MKRLSSWLFRGLLCLVLLACAGLAIAKWYLGSASAARRVERDLQAMLGQQVTVGSIQGNLVGSSLVREVAVLNPGDGTPYLTMGRVTADLSLWSFVFGPSGPTWLEFDDLHLRLRFDASGNLLTQLPQMEGDAARPLAQVRRMRLTLEQEGRTPFTLEGIDVVLQPDPSGALTGKLLDPIWGECALSGSFVDQRLSVTLANKQARIDGPMLRSLPFVPPSVWKQIEFDTKAAPLTIGLTLQSASPQVRYRVQFADTRVRLFQTDRPDFLVQPVRGTLDGTAEGFSLVGQVEDSIWGKWETRARFVSQTGALNVQLDTTEVAFDQKKLKSLPYVPGSIWEQVQASGRTAVKLRLGLFTTKPDLTYRVDLQPVDTRVKIPSIDLDIAGASGRVVVEDNRVLLEKTAGAVAGGKILASGDLDFRPTSPRLAFDIDVRGLALRQLPSRWELPQQIEGKVSGAAKVSLSWKGNLLQTHGTGSGQIEEAKLAGFRTSEPIQLNLQADGKRFRFVPRSVLLGTLLSVHYLEEPEKQAPAIAHVCQADVLAGRLTALGSKGTDHVLATTRKAIDRIGSIHQLFRSRETTYLDANLDLQDVDLVELARRLELVFPVAFDGKISVRVKVQIPVNDARNLRAYRLTGTAKSAAFTIGTFQLGKIDASIDYRDGKLRLDHLGAEVPVKGQPSGTFTGSATLQVVPRGNLSANLVINALPLEVVNCLAGLADRSLAGRLSGQVRLTAGLGKLTDPRAYRGMGQVSCPALILLGQSFEQVTTNVAVLGGKVQLEEIRAGLHGGILTGSATASLLDSQPFEGTLFLRGGNFTRLAPAATPATGTLDVQGTIKGTFSPVLLGAAGTLHARGLQVSRLKVSEVGGTWTYDGNKLYLTNLDARMYKGSVTGQFQMSVRDWFGQVSLKLNQLDTGELVQALADSPLQVQGQASGQVSATFGMESGKLVTRSWFELQAPHLVVQGVPARQVRGQVDVASGKVWYRLEGDALGGRFLLDGRYPPAENNGSRGAFRVEHFYLGRIWALLGMSEELRPLRGVVSLSLPLTSDSHGAPIGRGKFEVRDIRWHDSELSDILVGELEVGADGIKLKEVSGQFAGGSVRLVGAYRFKSRTGWFNLNATDMEGARLFLDSGDIRGAVQGRMDLMLRGQLGQESRGSGSALLHRGKIFGVGVSDWRVPFDFTFCPGRGQGEMTIRESSAQVGSGRARLRATVQWADHFRIEGQLRLFDASLHSLGGLMGDVSTYARGRVTGRADFHGSEMRSLNDLNANVSATLSEAQALQLPVLRQIAPYLMPGQTGVEFREGTLQGRLSGGVFRISELSLEGALAQMFIQGSVTTAGRLDLGILVQAMTPGINPIVLRVLARTLPPVGPIPVGLILKATDLLAQRIVRLRLTGTARSPTIQVEPIRILSEEAIRFFLTRAIPYPG